jgi:nitrogen fixation/metabolism regulation signal transduction histidine kinase
MKLRTKILLYLVGVHVILGGLALFALVDRPWLLLVAELVFVGSAIVGYRLLRAFIVPLELIRTGAELMRERDFTTHFREVGQSEMDELVSIYNRMIDQLREERRRVEERNLFLDKVLEASPTGVVTLDHDGNVGQVNPAAARLTGVATAELVGERVDRFPAPIAAALRDLNVGGSAVLSLHGSRRLRCRRGSFYDRGFTRDFFLLEELTDELRESEKAAYSKLIRMMSHEVNNSVGAVRSLLESCQAYGAQLADGDREDYDQALHVASERLAHLGSFMAALGQVVRIPPPDLRPTDVARLLSDVALLVQPELERRSIALEWAPPASFPELALDKNQFEQVLVNVLRNAMDAIGENGTVGMSLSADGESPSLVVRDDGPGIPPEAEPHLFTPFFSTKREGQGIGLTLVREILVQHGCDFDLRNADPAGAEFRIVFRPQ